MIPVKYNNVNREPQEKKAENIDTQDSIQGRSTAFITVESQKMEGTEVI